jgi:hypothetical protein
MGAGRGDFVEIMEMLDKRLNDKGKNWRHVFKVRSISHFIFDHLNHFYFYDYS